MIWTMPWRSRVHRERPRERDFMNFALLVAMLWCRTGRWGRASGLDGPGQVCEQ